MKASAVSCFVMLASLSLAEPLVPEKFVVPQKFEGEGYRLVPLGPAVAELDFKAYMGSIDHVKASMGGGNWPSANLTLADQAKDMAGEQAQWQKRDSFPYAVLSADGKTELGCFYIRPSTKAGYDAVATLWVTKEQFDKGFEDKLYRDMKAWLAASWPFTKVGWPGKEISRAEWKRLPAKP